MLIGAYSINQDTDRLTSKKRRSVSNRLHHISRETCQDLKLRQTPRIPTAVETSERELHSIPRIINYQIEKMKQSGEAPLFQTKTRNNNRAEKKIATDTTLY